jgi:hypothetical protein
MRGIWVVNRGVGNLLKCGAKLGIIPLFQSQPAITFGGF